MKGLATALAVTGLLALGACNRDACREQCARRPRRGREKAEGYENQAKMRVKRAKPGRGLDNRAGAAREAGENQANSNGGHRNER